MRIAIYGRVSTSHQVDHQTIEQQFERLTAAVHARAADGWVIDPTHVFRDDGYSGAVLARPGLDRLRDAVKGCEVDRVLITAPDRLARNYVHQMVLMEEWAQAGCAAEFLDRPMSDDPHDHLLLQIRGAVAEYERTLIAERMRRGRLAKLRAGGLLPWTYAPYGYRTSPDRPRDPRGVTLDPAEAAVVAELFALYREPGTSLMRLAIHLDARGVPTPSGKQRWSSPTVRGILRNPTYTGQVYAQRTQYRAPTHRRSATHPIGRPHGTAVPQPADSWLLVGQVPAVVSQPHFDEVQTKLATNRSFARRNNTAHQYLLRALVSCGHCGLACTARAINKRNLYYLCNGKGHSTYSHRATCCPARYTPASQLDELVWKDLCALLAEPGPLAVAVERAHGGAWLPQELLARRETLRRAQAHLSQQLERLTDAYLRAVFPLDEYERRRRDLEQRMRALAGQEELLRHDVARRQQLAGVAASLEAFRARVQHGLAAASFEQRRQLVLLLIDRVIVTDAEVEIRYVLPTNPESEHVRFCHLRKDYFSNLRVISRGTTFAYKGQTVDPMRIGRELGARYLIEGSARKSDNRIRVSIQLADARGGLLLWSERYEQGVADVFTMQDAIVQRLVGTIAVKMTRVEQERALAKAPADLAAYDYVLRGRQLLARRTRAANAEARELFRRATELDPRYTAAQVGLGYTYMDAALFGWTEWPARAVESAKELAQKAVDLDDDQAGGHTLLGLVYENEQRWDLAEAELDRAVELNPGDPEVRALRGAIYVDRGRLDEAIRELEIVLSFDPISDPAWSDLGTAYYLAGRSRDAIEILERNLSRKPDRVMEWAILAAAYAELGLEPQARDAAAKVLKLSPFFATEDLISALYKVPSQRERLAADLHSAGLP